MLCSTCGSTGRKPPVDNHEKLRDTKLEIELGMLAPSLQAKHATQRISLNRVTAKRRVRMCSETAGPFERSPSHLASTKVDCSPLGAFRAPYADARQHAMKARRGVCFLRKQAPFPHRRIPGHACPGKKLFPGHVPLGHVRHAPCRRPVKDSVKPDQVY